MPVIRLSSGIALTALLLVGCKPKNEFIPPPPPQVTVETIGEEAVTVFREFPGKTEALQVVQIRARVTGFLQTIKFKPGAFVKPGQLLFTIEPDTYEAEVEAAEGRLAKAKADLAIATTNRERREQAFKTRAVAELDVKAAEADELAAAANVKSAEASLQNARINLEYTAVQSPIAGMVSRHLVDIGNLVSGSEGTLLTTVVNDDKVYAYFDVNERVILPYLTLRQASEAGERRDFETIEVRLKLSDDSIYETIGRIDFIDNVVDERTGTIRMRAIFPNEERKLSGGLFCSIMIPTELDAATLVPRQSIQRDLAGRFVLTVDENNVVQRIPVELGAYIGDRQVVEGLEPGSRVIVSGLQRAREGVQVNPRPAGTPAENPPSE